MSLHDRRPISHVTVVVPAADEQERIAACLDAVASAQGHLARYRPSVQTSVIVVLDHCLDTTPEVVALYPGVIAVASTARNVGAARRLGAEQAIGASATPEALWLANTDADSRVPPDWLTRMVDYANRGADVVLGTVVPDGGLAVEVEDAWFAAHYLREGHPHVHGSNFGVRASTYLSSGGWQPMASGEDVDLALRAAVASAEIIRTATIPVVTSARSHGRAPHGFSSYLRRMAGDVFAGRPGCSAAS
jgi:cellulose synthase/poly-beta-1,6-N-acetylglucosamine synthase-like glycosyltransferase